MQTTLFKCLILITRSPEEKRAKKELTIDPSPTEAFRNGLEPKASRKWLVSKKEKEKKKQGMASPTEPNTHAPARNTLNPDSPCRRRLISAAGRDTSPPRSPSPQGHRRGAGRRIRHHAAEQVLREEDEARPRPEGHCSATPLTSRFPYPNPT